MEAMESLNGSDWDAVIAGTGLHQSLLALALSRSGKKILHLDRNGYYGGAEAALSLKEAETWAASEDSHLFQHASVYQAPTIDGAPSLGPSRSYSLALAPQLIYTQSRLLSHLVSSKVYRQLEFLAMGSWFVYSPAPDGTGKSALTRVPTNREDVAFSSTGIDIRSKRAVMKVLRFVVEYEEQADVWEPYRGKPFTTFLAEQFKLPDGLMDLFLALTLSRKPREGTLTEWALPKVSRHLLSIGRLGPGFSAVMPKWGGLSELVQVGCRAGAVGGAVYVLGNGVKEIGESAEGEASNRHVTLTDGETVKTRWVIGAQDDLPERSLVETSNGSDSTVSRSITIVSSPLRFLFPPTQEGAPPPAGAMVVFPSGSISNGEDATEAPIWLTIHTAETGECPPGQSVIYASMAATNTQGLKFVELAVQELLRSVEDEPAPAVLWSLKYQQSRPLTSSSAEESIITFSPVSLDLAFDDEILTEVQHAWRRIVGTEAEDRDFLKFEDREGEVDEDDY